MNLTQKNSGGGVPKSPNPLEGPPTPDPLGSDPFIYQSIALNLRIPNIQFLMGSTRDVQKLCSLGPPGLGIEKFAFPVASTCTLHTLQT